MIWQRQRFAPRRHQCCSCYGRNGYSTKAWQSSGRGIARRMFLAAPSGHIVVIAAGLVGARPATFPPLPSHVRSNSMTHAIRFHKAGGPEVLAWEEVQLGKPGPGEARIRHTAVGLNFVDIYNRSGLYPMQLPSGLGGEAAGVVEEVGAGVTDLKSGDRVAYGAAPIGAYAEARMIPADRLLKLPDGIDDKTAAAMMLKGLTTQYLIRQTYRVKAGDTILLHAAAGGVGLILGQWAKHLGATGIGTEGSDEKA